MTNQETLPSYTYYRVFGLFVTLSGSLIKINYTQIAKTEQKFTVKQLHRHEQAHMCVYVYTYVYLDVRVCECLCVCEAPIKERTHNKFLLYLDFRVVGQVVIFSTWVSLLFAISGRVC